jgi:RNA polymerase sigma factor (sigma-70 family)
MTGMQGHDDLQFHLIARCRAGDQAAWRAIVERYAGLVNGILRGGFRLGPVDAEDAFQEVFTRLYVRLDSVRDDQALAGWIAQVTRNVALDWLRRAGRELPTGDAIEMAGDEDPVGGVLTAMVVRDALMRLPDHQREIIERFFVQDESYQTIAVALDIPPGTIASRISRALVALRDELEGRREASASSVA